MSETGLGAFGAERGGPKALLAVLLAADIAVWATASVMLASYGL